MSSIPRSYIDDIRRIAQSVLNQLESLKVRSLHGLEEVNGVAWTGGGGVTDHDLLNNLGWTAAGHIIDANIDMNSHHITELIGLSFVAGIRTINFDTGDFIEFDNTNNYFHFSLGASYILSIKDDRIIHNYLTYHNANIDMNNHNIIDINELWFNTSDPGIKFDTGDFIWFDTSENKIFFEIASDNICYISSTGIHPDNDSTYYLGSGSAFWKGLYVDDVVVEAGTYITGDGAGNMELHVATGKSFKLVVG